MTTKTTENAIKAVGGKILGKLLICLLLLAWFAFDVISDYVKAGFDFSKINTFAYWFGIIYNNIARVAMCIAYRSYKIDWEQKHNISCIDAKKQIESFKSVIYNQHLQLELEADVAKQNSARKLKMYETWLKNKIDKSRTKKKLDKILLEIKLEENKVAPNKAKLNKLNDKKARFEIKYSAMLDLLKKAPQEYMWKKVKGYKPLDVNILFSTANKEMFENDTLEIHRARETSVFVSTKVLMIFVWGFFVGSFFVGPGTFGLEMLWNTAFKLFFGVLCVYTGGSSGTEFVEDIVTPTLNKRVAYVQSFLERREKRIEETIKQELNSEQPPKETQRYTNPFENVSRETI